MSNAKAKLKSGRISERTKSSCSALAMYETVDTRRKSRLMQRAVYVALESAKVI